MDPNSGGVGKAAGELMKEMQEAQQEAQKMQQGQGPNAPGGFQNVMQAQQTQQVQEVQEAKQVNKATSILQQAKINQSLPTTRVGAAAKAKQSQAMKMLEGLIGGQDKMTQIMKMALSGRQMSPPELLAMQAGIYRFSQELELTSKVVEKATSGLKQTMNTQV